MKLKLTFSRADRHVDLAAVVDATVTVGELAQRVAMSDPTRNGNGGGSVTLKILDADGGLLAPSATLVDAGVRSGARFVLTAPEPTDGGVSAPHAMVTVVSGPDVGREFPLPAGTSHLGREAGCEVRLDDPLVSRQHAKIIVGEVVEVVDLGSANGVAVGGVPVARAVLRPGDVVEVGETAFSVQRLRPAAPSQSAHIDFNRSPRLAPRYGGAKLIAPEAPSVPQRRRFPMIPLMAPLLFGAILFAVTRSPTSLVFVALSPVMMLGNVLESRISGKRDYQAELETYRMDLAELDRIAESQQEEERALRKQENPATMELVEASHSRAPLLWTRRPEHEEFLSVRLGLGRQSSRTEFEVSRNKQADRAVTQEAVELADRYARLDDVPVVEHLDEIGGVGIAGPRDRALPIARALVAQVATLHSPAEVVIVACASSTTSADWEWLKWLPHTSSPHSPLPDLHLASAAGDAATLIESLEELVATRADADVGDQLPAVVCLVDDPAADRSRLVAIAETGSKVGLSVIWVERAIELIPAICRTYVDVSADEAQAGFVRQGAAVEPLAAERLEADDALGLARSLAPVQDAGAPIDDASDLPTSVPLVSLISPQVLDSADEVIDRWRESNSLLSGPLAVEPKRRAGALRAVVGQGPTEPFTLDLRSQGPHALVGGTTGSGKSELLQSWILSLASTYSPERVTFLLVDYKGGSAFRECRELPHTVGLVTDLTPHLVHRTLVSLNAELRYREELFATKRAKDLVELEKAGDATAPPSLIIVVDEFAALVQEVPEFVDGVVNVGQRGRSLGLHLILATQRPAGVIKENLRANTNLRLALRVADEADSVDVVGSPVAATFDADAPGRAVAKIGPGRVVSFQSAYVGGQTDGLAKPAQIALSELQFGRGFEWNVPEVDEVVPDAAPVADITRMVETIKAANAKAELPAPRRPWLAELATAYDLAFLPSARSDDSLVFGVLDDPDRQAQPTAAFLPDRDGNLVVFGTGGSGKSAFLRTIAVAAGFTVRGGPCEVYGLDFGSRGLAMLEQLPHVGAVIDGDDHERIARLLRRLRATIDERADRYAAVRAGSLPDYRRQAEAPSEPRILVLLDGVASFRQAYEVGERSPLFEMLLAIAADGRPVGVHLVVSADRPASVPSALGSSVQRRVVLRLADETEYGLLGLPNDVLTLNSPPGRGLLDGNEVQVAVLAGTSDVLAQAEAASKLAASMTKAGVESASSVERLAEILSFNDLPTEIDGLPVLGIESESLAPIGFTAVGSFLVSGPPGSGRTSALVALHHSLRRWKSEIAPIYIGNVRSSLPELPGWERIAVTHEEAAALIAELDLHPSARRGSAKPVVFIEGVPDFVNGVADIPLQEFVKRVLDAGGFVVGEGETTALAGSYPLQQLVKSYRTGIALQPDQVDGTSLFRTNFPRSSRAEFPAGRGFFVSKGRAQIVQVPLLGDAAPTV
jgi:S-DNA-T family DNA segregation ATPase FtsK/SpoIIIE